MKKYLVCAITVAAIGGFSAQVVAAPVDLSTWSAVTLDYSGGQPAGNWVLNGTNTVVTQTVNADPSFYLNNINQTSYTMNGSWSVKTSSDDDYMGFVFGYQNSSNFYLFDWKQGTQGYVGTTAAEGMTVKKFTGATGDGLTDLSLAELWENETDFGDMEVLATNHGSTKGWASNVLYDFELNFGEIANQFSITVKQGATTLWNTTINDATFNGGQFGFYNYSQSQVEYAGFEQTGGVPVSEPGIIALFSVGLLGVSRLRRRS